MLLFEYLTIWQHLHFFPPWSLDKTSNFFCFLLAKFAVSAPGWWKSPFIFARFDKSSKYFPMVLWKDPWFFLDKLPKFVIFCILLSFFEFLKIFCDQLTIFFFTHDHMLKFVRYVFSKLINGIRYLVQTPFDKICSSFSLYWLMKFSISPKDY